MTEISHEAAGLSQTVVFSAGEGGYHTYRIPAVITTAAGTVLAFCEGRRHDDLTMAISICC